MSLRAVVIACGLALACSREKQAPRKTTLVHLPDSVASIAVSEDAEKYAYVVADADGKRVVHDGMSDDSYPDATVPTFAPVTRKLFYWAGAFTGPGYLVADGTRIGDFGRDGTLVFCLDGTRWATAAGTRELKVGDETKPGPVIVLADGKKLGSYPDASVPSFSADGRHLAYLVGADDATKLVVDGTERASYVKPTSPCAAPKTPFPRGPNFWPQFQVRYQSDGRLLVMTQDEDGWGIYRDGTRVASYAASVVQTHPRIGGECPRDVTAIAAWSFTTAEKAPVAAWWERMPGNAERWRVVRNEAPADDVVCSRPWLLQPPELSADGRHLAYACSVSDPEDSVTIVLDGRRFGPYRDMWAYALSDDGVHVAYGADDGMGERPWKYYVDGEARTESFAAVWRPRVEAGTGRLAWESRLEGDQGGVLGIERRRLASFDQVVFGPRFLHPGTVTWVIRRGRRLVRLDVPTR